MNRLCEGGELFDKIINSGGVCEEESRFIIQQLLSALVYLHNKQIAHKDIKPENILMLNDNSNIVKLIDFGIKLISLKIKGTATFVEEGKFLKEKIGTPYYIAPEVIKKKYNEKCDIWSSGKLKVFYNYRCYFIYSIMWKASF